ncbi:MAG: CcdB-like toxin protein [Pseudomonadota bacterium]|jgi:toxin CcdB
MAKFDVYSSKQGDTLLLDCQADLLEDLSTRFVVPLLPETEAPKSATRLNPVFTIADERYVMATQFAATVPLRELEKTVQSLIVEQDRISLALDMLISGF